MTEVVEVNESGKGKMELANDGLGVKDGEKKVEIEREKGEEGNEEVEEEVEEQVEEEVEEEVKEEVEEEVEEEREEESKELEEVSVLKTCYSIQSDVPRLNVEKEWVKSEKEDLIPDTEGGDGVMLDALDIHNKHQGVDDEVGFPNIGSSEFHEELMKGEELKNEASNKEDEMDAGCRNPHSTCLFDADTSGGGESGTEDEQAAFIFELDKFHKERILEFKPPKFYGEPVNLLRLWRSVMKLGGYDKVTACKYWRQIGDSFKPPKSETTIINIGSPADWVKINVCVTEDCYEVYALVPGLLQEEVRVQSDPAGRLVISGEPENPDNPRNVTPFKKVVNLPTRIDPHQTSAVVTLHRH